MKKLIRLFTITFLVVGLWAMVSPGAMAQEIITDEDPAANLEAGSVPLSALGVVGDIVLRGPWDINEVRFTPPPSWALQPGASLMLNLEANITSPEGLVTGLRGATVQVSLNGDLISTVMLDQLGDRAVRIAIPTKALVTNRTDGRHVLRFFLDASVDCDLTNITTVVIGSDSVLDLPHEFAVPTTDLVNLPRPIYQRDSFLPESVSLVVPDDPTAEELEAAMTVAAGFGRMSNGNLVMPLVPVSALTEETKASSHLVVVGKPAGLGLLSEVGFVSPVGVDGVNIATALPDDGVVQMAVSPWNTARVVLYAGGNTDVGVVKAAQAISFGALQPGDQPSLSVIGAINPDQVTSSTAVDRTLEDLGYPTISDTGIGTSVLEYHFTIPSGLVPDLNSYFNLVFTHSAFADPARSGLVVELNDQRIGSTAFSEETAEQVNSVLFELPVDGLKQGDNKLVIRAELRPLDLCSDFISSNLWFSAYASSLLHLPLVPAEMESAVGRVDLSEYPYPFSSDPAMSNLGFVLTDAVSWNVAAQIAAKIGREAFGQILNPSVALAGEIGEEFLAEHDLVVIGRPSEIPLIAEMYEVMPAPFEPGSDQASERSLPIQYRLPAGASLGYLEILSSPWNAERSVLTVLGSTAEGMLWAGNALVDPALSGQLTGNYAVVNRDQVQTADTRLGVVPNLSATAVPGGEVEVVEPVSEPVAVEAAGLPDWLMPVIIASVVLTAVFVLYLVVRGIRGASSR